MLLQIANESTQNGMDITWTTANVITLAVGFLALVGAWIKMIVNKTQMESKIQVLTRDLAQEKQDRIDANEELKVAKSTIKMDLNLKLEESVKLIHSRISKTQEKQENFMSKVDSDFKELDKKLVDIKGGVDRILGKLNINP